MPTNLPPAYYEVEKRYKAASTPTEEISLLEELISTVPKHKGTDKLRGDLKKKLSKLKSSSQGKKKGSRQASVFQIDREGAGQVVLIGPANVGKSALVRALTNATPEVSDQPYTTWTPTPGMMMVDHVQIQLIDTPPLDRDYIEPELLDLIRRADLVLLVVDLQTYPIQQIEDTLLLLEDHNIIPLRFKNRHSPDRLTRYVPIKVLVNKYDDESADEVFEILCQLIEGDWECMPVSAVTERNLDNLRRTVYQTFDIIRVYPKPPGEEPDLSSPFVLNRGSTVEEFASKIHLDFYHNLKSARLWGSSAFDGQKVGRDHILEDGDIVELRI